MKYSTKAKIFQRGLFLSQTRDRNCYQPENSTMLISVCVCVGVCAPVPELNKSRTIQSLYLLLLWSGLTYTDLSDSMILRINPAGPFPQILPSSVLNWTNFLPVD